MLNASSGQLELRWKASACIQSVLVVSSEAGTVLLGLADGLIEVGVGEAGVWIILFDWCDN